MKLHACSRRALAAFLWRLCSVGQCGFGVDQINLVHLDVYALRVNHIADNR
jgi:hypothetical protein